VAPAGGSPPPHERPVPSTEILDFQRLAHAQNRTPARHRRIVDAHGARLGATDRHLAGAGQVERPDLASGERDQLVLPLRHRGEYTLGMRTAGVARYARSGWEIPSGSTFFSISNCLMRTVL
jgi:hypothetical protein